MPTKSLTDQLRLLEEEIAKIEASGVPLPYTQTLLAVAKGLEAELTKAQADLLPHYAAIKAGDKLVDELSNERAALRAENERLVGLVESAIIDFDKLAPIIGEAAGAVANLYREDLKKC